MRHTILIVSNVTGGLVNFRKELLEELTHEYDIIVLAEENIGKEVLEQLNCKFINISIERHGINPIKDISLLKQFFQIIKLYKPLAVLTYTIKPNIYAGIASARLNIPYISNITGLGDAIENPGVIAMIARTLYKYGLRKARKVFFQNNANCEFFISKKIYSGDYEVLPGSGVNLQKHPFEEYPTNQDKTIISVVGRITKDKGIDEILEATKQLADEKITIRLIGNCEENYMGKIENAKKTGMIEFVGRQTNIHDWYKTSHAILHASYHEGMSNVLLEAAASGRPIIATNIPGCREAFDDGVSGIAFEPKNVESLVNAIKKFASLPYERKVQMGKNGRQKMEMFFNRQRVIERYIDTIHEIEEA